MSILTKVRDYTEAIHKLETKMVESIRSAHHAVVEEKMDVMKSKLATANAEIATLKNSTDTLERDLQSAKEVMTKTPQTPDTEKGKLKLKLKQMERELDKLRKDQKDKDDLSTRLREERGNLQTASTERDTLKNETDRLQSQLQSSNTALQDIQAKHTVVQKELISAQEEIIELKMQLGAMSDVTAGAWQTVGKKTKPTADEEPADPRIIHEPEEDESEPTHDEGPAQDDKEEPCDFEQIQVKKVLLVGSSQLKPVVPQYLCPPTNVHKEIAYTIQEAEEVLDGHDDHYDAVVLHLITNDVKTMTAVQCKDKMSDLIDNTVKTKTRAKVIVSLGIARDDNAIYDLRRKQVNLGLQELYHDSDRVMLCDHRLEPHGDIARFWNSLYEDDYIHLSEEGTRILAAGLKRKISQALGLKKPESARRDKSDSHSQAGTTRSTRRDGQRRSTVNDDRRRNNYRSYRNGPERKQSYSDVRDYKYPNRGRDYDRSYRKHEEYSRPRWGAGRVNNDRDDRNDYRSDERQQGYGRSFRRYREDRYIYR